VVWFVGVGAIARTVHEATIDRLSRNFSTTAFVADIEGFALSDDERFDLRSKTAERVDPGRWVDRRREDRPPHGPGK
jgi:hypothetical protein